MHPWDQATEVACAGFLVLSPKTMPNESVYRPDYLFHAVICISESYPSKSHVSKDLQDGPLVLKSIG